MNETRRSFLTKSAGATAAVGALAITGARTACAQEKEGSAKKMVAACGLACDACPLMKAGKCKGCGPGNGVSEEMVKMKNCAVLTCANMKKIAFCGTDCKKFTDCAKIIGKPYDKTFIEMIKTRLG